MLALLAMTLAQRFHGLRDDYWKWFGMPYPLARPALVKLSARVQADRDADPWNPFLADAAQSFQMVGQVVAASIRMDRRRDAVLRAIEAIRMHAAAHGGTPPAKLADITVVPVPDDPLIGNPFGYEAKDNVVTLTAAPPDGEAANEHNSVRYEITVRRP